jgi:hypothetical protein
MSDGWNEQHFYYRKKIDGKYHFYVREHRSNMRVRNLGISVEDEDKAKEILQSLNENGEANAEL